MEKETKIHIGKINKKILFIFIFCFMLFSFVSAIEGVYTGDSFDVHSIFVNGYFNSLTQNGTFFWITEGTDDDVYKLYMNGTYTGSLFDIGASGNGVSEGITQNGTFFWITDRTDDKVYKYYMNGTYSSSWATSPSTLPYGITQNGTFFWIIDPYDDEVYKYFMNGTYTGISFDTYTSGNTDARGITQNGTFFWITDYTSNKVYRYFINGTYNTYWDTSPSITSYGITQNGTFFWIVDLSNEEVYKYYVNYIDTTPPTFTTIPSNSSLFYSNQSLSVDFDATDIGGFGYFSINDTRFSITQAGILTNNSPMAVGTYTINITINDTSNNKNWTFYKVQINKSNNGCNFLFNASSPLVYPTTFLAYTDCDSTYTLYRNATSINNASTINSGAGYYNLTVQRTDTTNYTNTVDTEFFTITKSQENCKILFNTTSPITYPATFLAYANCTTPFTLKRNDTAISNNSIINSGASAYNISFLRTDTQNYSIIYNETQFIVNKGILAGTSSSSAGWTTTYGTSTTISFTESNLGDSDASYFIWRDGVNKSSGETVNLAVGTYTYILNSSGGTNYSTNAAIDTDTLTINRASAQTGLTFNATSPQTYNNLIIPTCSVITGTGTSVLQMNGTTIASGSTQNLAAGYYQFNCSLTQSANYSYAENISYFTIDKNPSFCGVYFNITSPITFPSTFIAYTNCSTPYTFYVNGTSINNASTINSGVGYYNLTVQRTDTINYSSTFVSSFFTINKKALTGTLTAYPSWNVNTGTSVTINFTETNTGDGDVNYFIWRDGVNKSTSDAWTTTIGTFTYILNSSGGTNYTSNSSINSNLLSSTNSAPTLVLSSPDNDSWSQSLSNSFVCNSSDIDGNLKNITLYAWKGATTFSVYQNIIGSSNSTTFSSFAVSEDGAWLWNCLVYDNSSASAWATANRTINIDTVNPTISYGINTENNNTNFSRNWIYVNTSRTESNFKNITFYLYNSTSFVEYDSYTDLTSFQNFTSLPDGIYYHNATIYDLSGRSASTDTYKITLDNINPSISYNSDTQANGWINKNFIFINLTASDTNKNSVWLTWNGVNETFASNDVNYYWENKTGLSDGTYTFSAGLNDSAGNSNITSSRTINLDITNPLIDWSTGVGTNNTNYSQSNIYFNITKTEVNCNKTFFYWKLLGGSWQSYNSSSCETSYNKTGLSNGEYQYYVLIVDNATNQNQTSTKTIRLDTIAPTLNIIFPVNLNVYNYNNQTLNFTASDNLVGLSMCWKQLNTGQNITIDCSLNSTVNSSTDITLEGTNTIYLWANDTLGHLASAFSQFSVSTGPPAVTLDFPSNNQWLNYKNNLFINSTGTDTDGISVYEVWGNWSAGWHMNYTSSSITSGVQNYITINVSDGTYMWNAWYNDSLGNGNFSSVNKTFNVDTINPLIDFTSGNKNNNVNLTDGFIYVNISINETNFNNITFDLYETSGLIDSSEYTYLRTYNNFTGLSSGIYYYNVTTYDLAGNKNTTNTYKITLDNINPAITLIKPQHNSYNSTASQNFTANFSDNLGIKNATLYIYNQTDLENSSDITFTENVTDSQRGIVITLLEGIKNWFYSAWDWAGNIFTSGNSTIIIDTNNPSVIDSGFSPTTIYNETNITIYVNVTDTNLDKVWIEMNHSGTYQNITITTHSGNQYYYSLSNSLTGNNENISWNWWANDSANNFNLTALNYFVVSNRNPHDLTITTPSNNSYISTDYLIINFSAIDDDYDTLNYSVYYGNNTLFNTTLSNSINLTEFNTTDGAINSFYINVSDGYLTEVIANYTFTIDKGIPNLTINAPSASPVLQCALSNVYLNITATDTNVDYCSYNVTYGSLFSKTNTIFNCSNTNFNVIFDNSVQLLSVSIFDKAGNVNTSQRYLYFNSGHSSCVGSLGSPGGGSSPPEEPIDYGFCGDNICQDGTNETIDRGEDFYSCSIDCAVELTLENLNFETAFTNCVSKDEELKDKCYWKTRPGLLTVFVIIVLLFLFAILFSVKLKGNGGTRKIVYNQKFFKRNKRRRR